MEYVFPVIQYLQFLIFLLWQVQTVVENLLLNSPEYQFLGLLFNFVLSVKQIFLLYQSMFFFFPTCVPYPLVVLCLGSDIGLSISHQIA